MHDTCEMLITRAPMLAACTIARAMVEMSPALRRVCGSSSPKAFLGLNALEDWRIEISSTSGATPENPSAGGTLAAGGGGGGSSGGASGSMRSLAARRTIDVLVAPGCHAAGAPSGGDGAGGGTCTITVVGGGGDGGGGGASVVGTVSG